MKMKALKILTLILLLLICFTLLFSCTKDTTEIPDNAEESVDTSKPAEKENQILGKEGNIKFIFTVTHKNLNRVQYNIETSKDNLGDALLEGSVIKTKNELGNIIVTEVDDEKIDLEKDTASWKFYKDGIALDTSIFETEISENDNFSAVYTN